MKTKLHLPTITACIAASIYLVAYSVPASATTVTAAVQQIYIFQGNYITIKLHGHDKNTLNALSLSQANGVVAMSNDDCIDKNSGQFVVELIPTTTITSGTTTTTTIDETGQATYSLLLSAQAQGKTVTVRGTNGCTDGRENVNWIRIND